MASIRGSKHDFSSSSWSGGKICEPCHTPHHGENVSGTRSWPHPQSGVPLWNHETSIATYTLYNSDFMERTVGPVRPISRICLSCHDGTVALDSFGGKTGSTMIPGNANLGTDLSDDHPISVKWGAWFHGKLMVEGKPVAVPCDGCHMGNSSLTLKDTVPFPDGYVECVSCHDVHATRPYPKMLTKTMQGSALCLHCHLGKDKNY